MLDKGNKAKGSVTGEQCGPVALSPRAGRATSARPTPTALPVLARAGQGRAGRRAASFSGLGSLRAFLLHSVPTSWPSGSFRPAFLPTAAQPRTHAATRGSASGSGPPGLGGTGLPPPQSQLLAVCLSPAGGEAEEGILRLNEPSSWPRGLLRTDHCPVPGARAPCEICLGFRHQTVKQLEKSWFCCTDTIL